MPYEQLRLENQLCFPLYACSRAITRAYGPLLEESGLTYTQYITMMALWEYGTMSVKELGGKLLLDSGTLTPLLKKLEARGLVRLLVSLTPEGKALGDVAAKVPGRMASCVPLEADDAQQLAMLLGKLMRALDLQEQQ